MEEYSTFDGILKNATTHPMCHFGSVGHTGTRVDFYHPGMVVRGKHEVSTIQLKSTLGKYKYEDNENTYTYILVDNERENYLSHRFRYSFCLTDRQKIILLGANQCNRNKDKCTML